MPVGAVVTLLCLAKFCTSSKKAELSGVPCVRQVFFVIPGSTKPKISNKDNGYHGRKKTFSVKLRFLLQAQCTEP